MNQQFYTLVFQSASLRGAAAQQALTLGDVTTKAKAAVSDLDIRRTWILFGDP